MKTKNAITIKFNEIKGYSVELDFLLSKGQLLNWIKHRINTNQHLPASVWPKLNYNELKHVRKELIAIK